MSIGFFKYATVATFAETGVIGQHQTFSMDKITADITIEELVTELPASVNYLMEKGIKCIACGEPIWGTLESAAKEKGFDERQIAGFVLDLNRMAGDSQS